MMAGDLCHHPVASWAAEPSLAQIAIARFPHLTQCDSRLIAAAASGSVAYCGKHQSEQDQLPAASATRDPSYILDAAVVRWLIANPDAAKHVDSAGIRVEGALIPNQLDLTNVTVPIALSFANTRFLKALEVGGAELVALHLEGSAMPGLVASDAIIRNDLNLTDAVVNGAVDLADAQIQGDLDADGGRFSNPSDLAINAEGLHVGGRVYLEDPFSAIGRVEFQSAIIGGDLYANGAKFDGRFTPPNGKAIAGDALAGDGLKVQDIWIEGVVTHGKVHFYDAEIAGDLIGNGAVFLSHDDDALTADRIKVHGGIFLKGIGADGQVRFSGAELGGDLTCDGALLYNPDGAYALNGDDLKAKEVFLQKGPKERFRAIGKVSFNGADISGDFNVDGGDFENPGGDALNANNLKAYNFFASYTDDPKFPFKAIGRVSMESADLGGDAIFFGAQLQNEGGDALNADDLKARNVYLASDFRSVGRVSLTGATLSGELACAGGQFRNPKGAALDATGADIRGLFDADGAVFSGARGAAAISAEEMKVARSVHLRLGFIANGTVDLHGSQIGGDLSCSGARFGAPLDAKGSDPAGVALEAERTEIGGNVLLSDASPKDRFDAHGALDFVGADIKGYMADLNNGGPYQLDLEYAHLNGTFYDQQTSWPAPNNLKLDGFVYDGFGPDSTTTAYDRLKWLSLQPHDRFRAQPYEKLAEVLRESGDDSGARRVMIAMERDRRSGVSNPLRRLWNWLLWLFIGYGYDIWRAVWASAFLIVIGSALFTWGGRRGWIKPTAEHPDHYKPFNGFIYSLETLLPFVDLYQAKHWLPDAQSRAGRNIRRYLWIHTLLGWFLTTMIIAGVSGVVQK
ncbi:MAG TPA: hypothetical protein VFB15_03195 [Candidatus Binataceae bacterium]|nr:hypothetical protein [Candidatus Binataceae bacterium]